MHLDTSLSNRLQKETAEQDWLPVTGSDNHITGGVGMDRLLHRLLHTVVLQMILAPPVNLWKAMGEEW